MCENTIAIDSGLAQADIAGLNHRLRRGPHNHGGYVQPLELVTERGGHES